MIGTNLLKIWRRYTMFNKFVLIGTVNKPCEKKFSDKGLKIGTLYISTYEKSKNKDIDLKMSLFGDLVDAACYELKVGDLVIIDGKLSSNKWLNKNGELQITPQLIVSGYEKLVLPSKSMNQETKGFCQKEGLTTPVSMKDDYPF